VRESVTEPTLGHIRLEWWRENIAAIFGGGPVRHHPVAEALAAAIRRYPLARARFDRLIAARALDLDDAPPASLAALEDYAEATSAELVLLALQALGAEDPGAFEVGRHIGIAYALAGLLRALPMFAAAGRSMIPQDVAMRAGLDPVGWKVPRDSPALSAAAAEIAAAARHHLQTARLRCRTSGVPRVAFPALLPAVIADQALKRLAHARCDPIDPRLARADPLQSWRLALAALGNRF
jgi:NADH dehydrogenase [ubiquinone] 1 alpha subcomplex assembly factor 6